MADPRLVEVKERFMDKKPNTFVSPADRGHEAIDEPWNRLGKLRDGKANEFPETSTGVRGPSPTR